MYEPQLTALKHMIQQMEQSDNPRERANAKEASRELEKLVSEATIKQELLYQKCLEAYDRGYGDGLETVLNREDS